MSDRLYGAPIVRRVGCTLSGKTSFFRTRLGPLVSNRQASLGKDFRLGSVRIATLQYTTVAYNYQQHSKFVALCLWRNDIIFVVQTLMLFIVTFWVRMKRIIGFALVYCTRREKIKFCKKHILEKSHNIMHNAKNKLMYLHCKIVCDVSIHASMLRVWCVFIDTDIPCVLHDLIRASY